jgi:hypothetical protein
MKYLKWNRQVMEWGVISSADLTESDEGTVPERFRDMLVGMHVAHTTGEGEQVAWVDILATEEEERRLNDAR